MWTIDRITALCIEYCGRAGVKFNSPVIINGRLTRTLGRCFYQKGIVGWNPSRIEISRKLLETSTDKSIEAVIAHECGHIACHHVLYSTMGSFILSGASAMINRFLPLGNLPRLPLKAVVIQ